MENEDRGRGESEGWWGGHRIFRGIFFFSFFLFSFFIFFVNVFKDTVWPRQKHCPLSTFVLRPRPFLFFDLSLSFFFLSFFSLPLFIFTSLRSCLSLLSLSSCVRIPSINNLSPTPFNSAFLHRTITTAHNDRLGKQIPAVTTSAGSTGCPFCSRCRVSIL